MSGSDWGRHSKSCCQDTARKYCCEYCLINIARACNFFYHRCVKCALSYIIKSRRRSDEAVWYSPFIHVLSRLSALLTWAASLGCTSASNCCKIYREYHAHVFFTFSYVRTHRFCSSHHSNSLSYEKVTRPNSRIIWMAFFAQFCGILFIM